MGVIEHERARISCAAPSAPSAAPPPLPAQTAPPMGQIVLQRSSNAADIAPTQASGVWQSIGRVLASSPSWLVSMIVHLAVLIALALWITPSLPSGGALTLTASSAGAPGALEAVEIAPPADLASELASSVEAPALSGLASEEAPVISEAFLDAPGGLGEDLQALAGSAGSGAGGAGIGERLKAEFFGVEARGEKFVFIVDSSTSMRGEKFNQAKRELLYAINRLDKSQRFYVVFFDHNTQRMFENDDRKAEPRPLPATRENVRRLQRWLNGVKNEYNTEPYEAVKFALDLNPDAIFILSDGEFTDEGRTVELLAQENVIVDEAAGNQRRTIVHTIGFMSRAGEPTLKAIAQAHGGTYQYVDRFR